MSLNPHAADPARTAKPATPTEGFGTGKADTHAKAHSTATTSFAAGPSTTASPTVQEYDVVVIGAGQAGLSAGYHLQERGFVAPRAYESGRSAEFLQARTGDGTSAEPVPTFVMLDANAHPGGAWQYRWDSLTMDNVNNIFDLPGYHRIPADPHERSAVAVPRYFAQFEELRQFPILRSTTVTKVESANPAPDAPLLVRTSAGVFQTRAIINATGTWDNPIRPSYPGADTFRGVQIHTRDYVSHTDFAGQRVAVVGAGISAMQHMEEIGRVATPLWYTRREPEFRESGFRPEHEGRETIAKVTAAVEAGEPTGSVVSYTKLPNAWYIQALSERGQLVRRPMFTSLEPYGVREADGSFTSVDAVVWATGFKPAIAHLDPLHLRNERGGIQLNGTQTVRDARIQLVGFGPSQSTVGANRAGREAVRRVRTYLASLM